MFPNNRQYFDFWGRFGTKSFLASANFKRSKHKLEDRNQKFGQSVSEKHLVVYISQGSLTGTPKTVIGGLKSEITSEKQAVWCLSDQISFLALLVI